ncbi:MAG: ABC transporter permease [Cyclobacteriaceae bacterium]
MLFIKLVAESLIFAWQALKANVLRTILSLLGVTVGIFAIISVFTVVDSLERSIRDSLSFLGDQVIRVDKWPWLFQDSYPWWKYFNRPYPTQTEFHFLQENITLASSLTIFAERENALLQHESNSVSDVQLVGVSYEYNQVFETPLAYGRYFSPREITLARNIALIGSDIAENLFPYSNPLGKEIKIKGLKYVVVGVFEAQGENFIETPSLDRTCLIPYSSFLKLYASRGTFGIGSTIAIKGYSQDEGLKELEQEVIGLMRSRRGLRPLEEDSFAINRPEAFADVVSNIFDVIGVAGWIIGSFSILVGGFGIANIMFVSVRERTSMIGIQKSLGAKNYFILFQFLFEAIFLSLIGGLAGLFLVYLISFIQIGTLDLVLSVKNIILGLSVSGIVGIVSGLVPAIIASRMNPVEAIRS